MLCAPYLIEKHDDEIVAFETWANGKPYKQSANVEVLMLVRQIRYYAGWAGKLHGLTIPADGALHMQTLHEPISVMVRLFHGTSLFSYSLGSLDQHGHVTPLF
ncbi:unnamed protein product [Lupinus luteus]|uniref:Aldehyde dehydrogenase domain-containing protein n=1 Tax=Lupinus luteus TaxID=3873 RepID=A0AAV1WQ60_LUPLU